jgi:hypothetical protein
MLEFMAFVTGFTLGYFFGRIVTMMALGKRIGKK